MGPKCNYMYFYETETDGETHINGGDNATMEAETKVRKLQAKKCQQSPNVGRSWKKQETDSLLHPEGT